VFEWWPIVYQELGDRLVIAPFQHETEHLDLAGSQTAREIFVRNVHGTCPLQFAGSTHSCMQKYTYTITQRYAVTPR